MKRVNYHLTEPQILHLLILSKATGLSVAELIRRAIDNYLPEMMKALGISYENTNIDQRDDL